MNYFITTIIVSAVFSLTAIPSRAQPIDQNAHRSETNKVAQSTAPMTDGEIRKVDKETKKITISHGVIQNLRMPPMTMAFQIKDPAILNQFKAGDKVRFRAEKIDGAFTVTHIENSR